MRTIKTGRLHRTAIIERAAIDADKRTIAVAFSSEEPVKRWWGIEILGHRAEEIDLSWARSGAAPVLVQHNVQDVVGVVELAELGADGKARATLRFGSSSRAEEVWRDVKDGIRCNISVGYEVRKFQLVKEENEIGTYRATDWLPLEVSIVAVPSDMTVGVGRGEGGDDPAIIIEEREDKMEPNIQVTPAPSATPAPANIDKERLAARDAERARVKEIMAVGERHGMRAEANKAVEDGLSPAEFNRQVLDKLANATPARPASHLDLSERETRRYSLVRALHAMASRDLNLAPFEREYSAEIAKRTGRPARGIWVPRDWQEGQGGRGQRDLTVGTATAGGNLVATDLLAGSFIEMLRNRMMVRAMGATLLTGLVGSVAIPKQTGAATAAWVAEGAAPAESQQTIGQVTLAPKTVGAFTDFSRKLLLQSSIDVEQFVRTDLSAVLALALDLAALHGTGASDQPTGIASTSGIGSVAGGTNGAAPTWAHIVSLETEVAIDNADIGTLGYLSNAKVRGKLKQTEKAANTGQFVWGDNVATPGVGMLNGYSAGASNQVSSTLTKGTASGICSAIFFGNWRDLLIGEWGGLDILVDPYTASSTGTVRIRSFLSADIAVRNAESFAAMLDALTT